MFNIIKCNNQKVFDKALEQLNKDTAICAKLVFEEAISWCENENQKIIVNDWWNGKSVCSEEYKAQYNDHDNYESGSIIMDIISRGWG